MTGFTGVIWDARTTERLAADLAAGSGPAPLAEAGLAWGQVASALVDGGLEYGAILDRIGVNWHSAHSNSVHEKLASLVEWFARAGGEAAGNAVRAEAQAAAVTVARLTMPNLAETDLLERMRDVASATSAIAPALTGAAAHAERALHDQRMRAARVMATYEVASEPVAQPWMAPSAAPTIVTPHALQAEQAARERAIHPRHAAAQQTPSTPSMTSAAVGPIGAVTPWSPDRTRPAPTIVASAVTPSIVPTQTPSPAPSTPIAPPPPMASGAMSVSERHAVRPTVDPEATEAAGAEESPALETWEDIAAAEVPVAQHVSPSPEQRALDSRYVTETLSLGSPGGR